MESHIDTLGLDPADPTPEIATEAPQAAAEPAPVAEATAEAPKAEAAQEPQEPAKEQPRDNQGRFAKTDLDLTPPKNAVPLATLLEERAERKRIQAEYEARIRALEEANKPKAPEIPVPEFIEDPKGYVDAKAKQALAELERVRQEAEAAKQQSDNANLLRTIEMNEREFVAKNADYYDALDYARKVRIAQLQIVAPDADENQLREYVGREEIELATRAMQSKRNPSEVAYQMAKAMGYTPSASRAPEVPKVNPTPPPNKAGPAPIPPDTTLGRVAGAAPDQNDADSNATSEIEDVLAQAINERFGRKRA